MNLPDQTVPMFDQSLVRFRAIELKYANLALEVFGHKMGPLDRPNGLAICYGLFHGDELVSIATVSGLIRENVGGGLKEFTRDNTCELSRLCAERSGLCRVTLRLWREFVFPSLGYEHAISYQDADMHNGNTYRFDGWQRAARSRSGTDSRGGRKGRDKWVWVWPPLLEREEVVA